MKRILSPVLLFLAVFLVTLLAQKFSFFAQEQEGLFLLTPDYFAGRFARPLPLSGILGDFLSQFFRFSVYAPAIVAAGVTLAFLLLRSALRRLRLRRDWLPMLLAAGLWMLIAFARTPQPGTFAVLLCAALWLLSRLLPAPAARPVPGWADLAACALLLAAGALVVCLHPALREREVLAHTRYAVALGDWDRVLTLATPAQCDQDETLIPLALLALQEKGQLGERMFTYPVIQEDDFDRCDRDNEPESLFFLGFLYERLGGYNEAIHNFYQLSSSQDHGTSFLVLRQLLSDYYQLGNYTLAEKYCQILSRSTLHGQYVRHFRRLMAEGEAREPDPPAVRSGMPLASHNPLENLFQLGSVGLYSPAIAERTLCTLLLQGELGAFHALFETVYPDGAAIPRHYQEALLLAGQTPAGISPAVRQRFDAFQADMLSGTAELLRDRYLGTYWYYYLAHSQF